MESALFNIKLSVNDSHFGDMINGDAVLKCETVPQYSLIAKVNVGGV